VIDIYQVLCYHVHKIAGVDQFLGLNPIGRNHRCKLRHQRQLQIRHEVGFANAYAKAECHLEKSIQWLHQANYRLFGPWVHEPRHDRSIVDNQFWKSLPNRPNRLPMISLSYEQIHVLGGSWLTSITTDPMRS